LRRDLDGGFAALLKGRVHHLDVLQREIALQPLELGGDVHAARPLDQETLGACARRLEQRRTRIAVVQPTVGDCGVAVAFAQALAKQEGANVAG